MQKGKKTNRKVDAMKKVHFDFTVSEKESKEILSLFDCSKNICVEQLNELKESNYNVDGLVKHFNERIIYLNKLKEKVLFSKPY
jgi:hypothetical protein